MNRETILASVDRHLRESLADTGEVRPLGEVVARVASEIRSQSVVDAASHVVPIDKVAAFVDGNLDMAEATSVCEAALIDNSVLAEITAAVRAKQFTPDQLPALPASLSNRLLAMQAAPSKTADVEGGPSTTPQGIRVFTEPTLAPGSAAGHMIGGQRWRVAVAICAIAATIIAAIVLLGRQGDEAPNQDSVVDSDFNGQGKLQPGEIPDVRMETPEELPLENAIHGVVENDELIPPSEINFEQEGAAVSDPAIATTLDPLPIVAKPVSEMTPDLPSEMSPPNAPESVEISQRSRIASLRWTGVSGLLAQRNESTEASGSQRAPTWSRIQPGASSSSRRVNDNGSRSVALRTLPFSRADGEFESGGRIVIAGDTSLQITHRDPEALADVDLMYGSVAIVDRDKGSVVNLHHGGRMVATLRWQGQASAVVQRQAAGLQIQVDGGEIEVNRTSVKEQSVRVADDQTIETMRAPKRLPRWVTRGEASSAVDRMILAQIGDSNDLTASLNQKIRVLVSSPNPNRDEATALATLSSWQAAMAGPNLFRLAGSRVPALRLAALQRLTQLPESDPRYKITWNAIDRSINNPQRAALLRGWIRLLRSGARPNATQLQQILIGLSSRDIAGRALSDYVLRQYVRDPPPFDPSWSGQTLQRAINIYRQRAGLPMDRTRPNAAAPGAG